MSDQQKPTSAIGQAMPFVTAGLLIASFLWRTLTAAHEYPVRSEQVMTMLIDLGLIAGLYGMRQRLPAALFWIALASGVGLFHDGGVFRCHKGAAPAGGEKSTHTKYTSK